jgi:hypothetical protein
MAGIIEKTNERLTWDVSLLLGNVESLQAFDALIDASNNVSLSIAYMDASFAIRDANITATDASLYSITTSLTKTDASLYSVRTSLTKTDASLYIIRTSLTKTDASLYSITTSLTKTDASLYSITTSLTLTDASLYNNLITNASLGLAFSRFTNASLGLAFDRLTNASLGNNVRYRADLGIGLRNASGNIYDFAYVDTSAYLKIGATSWAQWKFETTTLG